MSAEKAALDEQIAATDAARASAMAEAREAAEKAKLLESQVVQLQRKAEDSTHALQEVMQKMQTNHEVRLLWSLLEGPSVRYLHATCMPCVSDHFDSKLCCSSLLGAV